MTAAANDVAVRDGWHYLAAAAVLTDFAPDQLRPLGGLPNNLGEVGEMLMAHGEPIRNGPAKGRWTLSNTSRRAALVELGRHQALSAAISANQGSPRPDNPTQRAIDALVEGRTLTFETMSLADLLGMERAIDFLGSAVQMAADLRPQLLSRIERLRLLEPLQRLVSHGFAGRIKEMMQLRAHVDQLASKSLFEAVVRGLDRTLDIFRDRPPLVVWGPGGVGKSTLLAKFVLDHAGPGTRRPLPFIHLDFDRGQLDPTQADSLLTEAFRQISVQFPEFSQEASKQVVASNVRGAIEDRSDVARSAHFAHSDALRARFAELVVRIGARYGPHVLLFIDTFELVQRRGSTPVFNVLTLTANLMRSAACLRVVIAGRIPLRESDFPYTDSVPRWKPLPLEGFDAEAGRVCLAARLHELKAPELSAADLDRVVALVRGNPLSLRLAAEVLARLGAQALETVVRNTRFDTEFTQERLQGYLHQRIVNALDEPVRRLADPGLVVRRLSPQVILDVLARPCGLAVSNMADAESLFYKLQAEVALVEPAAGGTLRHRADVRLLMLPLLRSKLGAMAADIDRAAVAFWAGQNGAVARAEQIYHLAWLEASIEDLEAVWQREPVPAALADEALDEFSALGLAPGLRIWLCGKLKREISPQLEAEASQAQWEQNAEQRARNLLSSGAAEEALKALRGRPAGGRKAGSNLWALELETLKLLGRDDEALRVADEALELATEQHASGQIAVMLLHRGALFERAGRFAEAAAAAAKAAEIAAVLGDEMLEFEGRLCEARTARLIANSDAAAVSLMAQQLAIFSDRPAIRAALARRPALLQEAAAEIGYSRPELLVQATRQSGERTDDPRAEALRLLGLGVALAAHGERQEALESLLSAESIARGVGDNGLRLRALVMMGSLELELAHFESAREAYSQVLVLAREQAQPELEVRALCELGNIDAATGDDMAAMQRYEQALAFAHSLTETQAPMMLLDALLSLASIRLRLGELEQAEAELNQVLSLARRHQYRHQEALALGRLAQANMAQGRPKVAAGLYHDAVRLSSQLGDRQGEALMLCNLAAVLLQLKDWSGAIGAAAGALRRGRELGDSRIECRALGHTALAHYFSGALDSARQMASQQSAIAATLDDRQLTASSDYILSLVADMPSDARPAVSHVTPHVIVSGELVEAGVDVESQVLDRRSDREEELNELIETTRKASRFRIDQIL